MEFEHLSTLSIRRWIEIARKELRQCSVSPLRGNLKLPVHIEYAKREVNARFDSIVVLRVAFDEAYARRDGSSVDDKQVAERTHKVAGELMDLISNREKICPAEHCEDKIWKWVLTRLAHNIQLFGDSLTRLEASLDEDQSSEIVEEESFLLERHSEFVVTAYNIVDRLYQFMSGINESFLNDHASRLRGFEQWKDKFVENLSEDRIDELVEVAQSVVIPDEMLRSLTSTLSKSVRRQKAIDEMRDFGFFIEKSKKDKFQTAISNPHYSIEAIEHDGKIIAYYILRTGAESEDYMRKNYGLNPSVSPLGDLSLLPTTSGEEEENRIHWSNPRKIAEVFDDFSNVACGGEIVVAKNAKKLKSLGSALKYRRYTDLLKRVECPVQYILIEIAEIVEINGIPLEFPITNIASVELTRKLRGFEIGFVQKIHERDNKRDKMRLTINWHVYCADIGDALRELERMKGAC